MPPEPFVALDVVEDDTDVVAECEGVGRGLGIPGPRGGYSEEGAVSALRRLNGRVVGASRDAVLKGMVGREGEAATGKELGVGW